MDEDANIIWGSAFNPELDGKIRVSVVATGIEGAGEAAGSADSSAVSLSSSRAPKRPVMALSSDDGDGAQGDPLDLGDAQLGDDAGEADLEESADDGMALDLNGLQASDGEDAEEEGDDVDGIVDPLEGLRSDGENADEGAGDDALDLSLGDQAEGDDGGALDLTTEAADVDDASEAEGVQPKISGRRRGLLGGVKTTEEEAAAPEPEAAPAPAPGLPSGRGSARSAPPRGQC